jgi:adenosylcobinamide-phosphate synthase
MSWPFPAFAALLIALAVERLAGYPDFLQRRIGHPVEWLGRLIEVLDRHLNRPESPMAESRLRGSFALLVLLAAAFAASWLAANMLALLPLAPAAEAIIASAFLAQHSLRSHVAAVAQGLGRSSSRRC